MKTNAECFESLMQREKTFKAEKKKRIRIMASLTPVAACLVLVVCMFPMMNQNKNASGDIPPGNGNPAYGSQEGLDGDTLKDDGTDANGAGDTKDPTKETTGGNSSIKDNIQFNAVASKKSNAPKVFDEGYEELWSYQKICEYYGTDVKIKIPDGYTCTSADLSYKMRMLDGKPFLSDARYQYSLAGKDTVSATKPTVCQQVSKSASYDIVKKQIIDVDMVILLTECNWSSINGQNVLLAYDGFYYYACVQKESIYFTFIGTAISESEFIAFLKTAIG